MNTVRFNITLPKDLGNKVKQHKNHSGLIAESLREKFERDEQARLEHQLAEAYADASREDKAVDDLWDITVGDGIE